MELALTDEAVQVGWEICLGCVIAIVRVYVAPQLHAYPRSCWSRGMIFLRAPYQGGQHTRKLEVCYAPTLQAGDVVESAR